MRYERWWASNILWAPRPAVPEPVRYEPRRQTIHHWVLLGILSLYRVFYMSNREDLPQKQEGLLILCCAIINNRRIYLTKPSPGGKVPPQGADEERRHPLMRNADKLEGTAFKNCTVLRTAFTIDTFRRSSSVSLRSTASKLWYDCHRQSF